jgi:hypothetical protein
MACPSQPHLRIVPGTLLVLFIVQLDSASTTLATSAGRFLEGLKASCDLLGFGAVQRDDERLDELLPWAGNV